METIEEIWIPGHLGKLEIRVDKMTWGDASMHRVVIADMNAGGEPVYISPIMLEEEALELWHVMKSLYDQE